MKILAFLAVVVCLLSGCSSTQLQAAAASASSAVASTVVDHIGGVNITFNPATDTWSGGVVFKDADGHYKLAADGSQVRSVDPCAEPATKIVRAVDPCGSARALGEAVDLNTRYVVETGGGLRSITGNLLVSSRSEQRSLTYSARDARQQERESYKALKDIHKAEVKRLDRIVKDNNQSMLGSLRRALSPSCRRPNTTATVTAPPTTWVETTPPAESTNVTPSTPTANPTSVPPSGEMKAATSVELRVAAIEANLNGLKEDVKAIREALKKP